MALSDVVVAGIGETPKRRPTPTNDDPYRDVEEYFRMAAERTLADAGLGWQAVDGLGLARPQEEWPFQYPLELAQTLGFEDLQWLATTDHCNGQAVPLLAQAATAVETGVVDSILCLGADTPVHPEEMPADPDTRGITPNFVAPFGMQGANARIAMVQRRHMHEYGTTVDQLGKLYVTQREHATRNPLAYWDEPVDLAEYRDSRLIADPVRLFDCVIPVNAGLGFLLTTPERAADLDTEPVAVRGFGNSHNPETDPLRDITRLGIDRAADRAFGMADIRPHDADFLQLYDCYPIIEAIEMGELGFYERGETGDFLERTDFRFDGDLPLNTGGGQLCAGQAGGAGGFHQVLEAVRQLRGEGGSRQVPGAETGIVSGVGARTYDYNFAQKSVAVLERGVPA
jgi:acetyl-CoA acetyltransferase